MEITSNISRPSLIAIAGLFIAGFASAAELDFSNPAVAISSKAVVDSGTCIAKYTVRLNNASQSVATVAKAVAKHCDSEISLSAGLAAFLTGKPEEFTNNLKYAREELTAHAVERYRANTGMIQVAQIQ